MDRHHDFENQTTSLTEVVVYSDETVTIKEDVLNTFTSSLTLEGHTQDWDVHPVITIGLGTFGHWTVITIKTTLYNNICTTNLISVGVTIE